VSGGEERKRSVIREPAAFAPPIGEALREAGLPTGVNEIVAEQRVPDASMAESLLRWLQDLVKEITRRDEPVPAAEIWRRLRERLAQFERDSLEDWHNLHERNRSGPELEQDY